MKRILLIPPRIVSFLSDHQGRRFKIIMMILVLITALYTKEYRGEYQQVINNQIGGIFYVMFGSLFFSLVFSRFKAWQVVLIAFTATCVLEFIQYLRIPFMVKLAEYKAFAYIFGISFNPADFIYYAAGAVISLILLLVIHPPAPTNP